MDFQVFGFIRPPASYTAVCEAAATLLRVDWMTVNAWRPVLITANTPLFQPDTRENELERTACD